MTGSYALGGISTKTGLAHDLTYDYRNLTQPLILAQTWQTKGETCAQP